MLTGKAWDDVNILISYLSGSVEVADLVDDYYLKQYGNSAPGYSLRVQIAEVVKHLNQGSREE